tara:strand:+ start:72 stop:845 length:774 start_codon:yes stop_codon:yes gene_type:complete
MTKKDGVVRRAIVIPDQHFPIHDEKAVQVTLKAIEIVKPDTFINLGDVGEWEKVSKHYWKDKEKPALEDKLKLIDQEILDVNKGIDRFDKVLDKIKCKNRYICAGNHDEWLDSFVHKHPYLEEYTFKKACRWKERGYKYYAYNHELKIGKLNFIHGAYATQLHAKKHLSEYKENIVYGHTHDIQRYTGTGLGGTCSAWSMGCLKDMSKKENKWLKGRLVNWNHCFGIIDWFSNGNFKLEVVEIVKGRTTLWGNLLEA